MVYLQSFSRLLDSSVQQKNLPLKSCTAMTAKINMKRMQTMRMFRTFFREFTTQSNTAWDIQTQIYIRRCRLVTCIYSVYPRFQEPALFHFQAAKPKLVHVLSQCSTNHESRLHRSENRRVFAKGNLTHQNKTFPNMLDFLFIMCQSGE